MLFVFDVFLTLPLTLQRQLGKGEGRGSQVLTNRQSLEFVAFP